jgi:hypothetical protein
LAEAGAHRFAWDFHEHDADGILVPPGDYTVRLAVNGRSYTREAHVLRDPRIAATDADLYAQYRLARAIESLRDEVDAARTKAQQRIKALPQDRASVFRREVVGEAPPDDPDDSVGSYSHDFTSFLYLENSLDYLSAAVESADAAPTPDMQAALSKLDRIYRVTLARSLTL